MPRALPSVRAQWCGVRPRCPRTDAVARVVQVLFQKLFDVPVVLAILSLRTLVPKHLDTAVRHFPFLGLVLRLDLDTGAASGAA